MWERAVVLFLLSLNHYCVEVLEWLCGDNIWRIERCPSKSNNHYLALQINIKHYCKAKIISKQIDRGIPAPYYDGYWFVAKVVSIELHKFWFCHDDLTCYVGGSNKKYALDRPALLTLWHVQEGKSIIQIEVLTL
jgi:hypothetical protein